MGCKSLFVAGVVVSSALAAPIDPSTTKFDTSKPEQNNRAVQHSEPYWNSPGAPSPYTLPGYYRGVEHDPGYDSYDSRAGYGGEDDYYRGEGRSSYGRDPSPYNGYGRGDYDRPFSGRSQPSTWSSLSDYLFPSSSRNSPYTQPAGNWRHPFAPAAQPASSSWRQSPKAQAAPPLAPVTDAETAVAAPAQDKAPAPAVVAPKPAPQPQLEPQPSVVVPVAQQAEVPAAKDAKAVASQEDTDAVANLPRSQESSNTDMALTQVSRSSVWQPAVGAKYQIVLSEPVDTKAKSVRTQSVEILPSDTQIFDIDLFDNDVEDIKRMKAAGKKVICYFSAGTWEKSRPDTDSFPATVKGSGVKRNNFGAYWDELWLDIRNPNPNSATLPVVWQLIKTRIELAAQRGCDAIDPDNMDAFDPDNSPIGFPIQKSDSVAFMRFMADEAAKHGMAIGLKNSMDMLDEVSDVIQFAVNEQCVQSNECGRYNSFLQGSRGRVGKPVFHIEYIDDDSKGPVTPGHEGKNMRAVDLTGRLMDSLCMKADGGRLSSKFSTVIKEMELGGWVQFCDGIESTTVTRGKADGTSPRGKSGSDSSDSSDSSEGRNSGSSRGGRQGSDNSDSSDSWDRKNGGSSRGGREGSDNSESADNSDSYEAEESRGSRSGGYRSSGEQSSSASSSNALGALGSGLASLFGYGSTASSSTAKNPYSSGHTSTMGHSGSQGHSGSSDYSSHRNTPSSSYSSSSPSSSSSSSFGSWISSIFTPKGSSGSTSYSSSSGSSTSSGGLFSGLSSYFGGGSASSVPTKTAAAPAGQVCQKSSKWNPLAIFNPANWKSEGC